MRAGEVSVRVVTMPFGVERYTPEFGEGVGGDFGGRARRSPRGCGALWGLPR